MKGPTSTVSLAARGTVFRERSVFAGGPRPRPAPPPAPARSLPVSSPQARHSRRSPAPAHGHNRRGVPRVVGPEAHVGSPEADNARRIATPPAPLQARIRPFIATNAAQE